MFKKMKANSAAFALWVLLTCGAHILLFRGKVSMAQPIWQRLILAAAALGLVLLVHELIHALFMKVLIGGRVRLIFAKDKLGMPTPGVLAEKRGTKGQEAVMRLAPFALMTLLPDVIFCFLPGVELFFFIVALANCAGCFYDILDVCMLLHGEAW